MHGYLLLDDRKISKSLGNVVDPLDLIDLYGADAVRFWCARSVSFGQDGAASIEGVRERYERELGNDLGNLLSRVTAMLARYRDGALASVRPTTRRSPRSSSRSATTSRRGSTRFDLTGALERIWEVVRALNRHVEATRAVAARQGRGARGRARPRPLRPRRRPARRRGRARRLPARARPSRILEALGQPARRSPGTSVAYGRTRGRRGHRAGGAALPARRRACDRGVIDTPRAPRRVRRGAGRELLGARGRGRRHAGRDHRHRDRLVPASARDRREANPGVVAALGIDPHRAATDEAGPRRRAARAARASARRRGRRDGPRRPPRRARRCGSSARCFDAQLALADELGLPVVIHSREASAETAAALAAVPRHGRPALLLGARRCSRRRSSAGYYVSFAGNVTYPQRRGAPPRGRRRCPGRPDPRGDRQPVPRAAAGPRPAERADARPSHARDARRSPGRSRPTSSRRRIDENATRGVRPRRRVTRVAPKKSLGQHFLVDRNVLGVIERLAQLAAERRRPRDRPGSRRPDDLPRRPGARTSTPSSSTAALEQPLRDGARRPNERRAPPSVDALALDLERRSTRRREARREPPVQRRDATRRRDARSAFRRCSSRGA